MCITGPLIICGGDVSKYEEYVSATLSIRVPVLVSSVVQRHVVLLLKTNSLF